LGLELIPDGARERYHIEERWHACAILATDFHGELTDIIECLAPFELVRSEIEEGGGGKSRIARRFDDFLARRGWNEKSVKVNRMIGDLTVDSETTK
jgi:hypothetical protein